MAHAILTSDTHRELRVRTERGAELGDAVMTALVVPDEFRRVQDEYPILFRLNHERDAFTPVALLGFETGENLFLDGDRWDSRYIPMSIDIQPFLIGGAPDAQGDKQVHVDLGSPRGSPRSWARWTRAGVRAGRSSRRCADTSCWSRSRWR
jgi:hypothetical protein